MGLDMKSALLAVAYIQGKKDALVGWPLLANPFADRALRRQWTDGWLYQANQANQK